MVRRVICVIGSFWIALGPIAAFWLMWEFAFGTLTDYYVGNALIALVLLGPPVAMFAIYLNWIRKSHDNP